MITGGRGRGWLRKAMQELAISPGHLSRSPSPAQELQTRLFRELPSISPPPEEPQKVRSRPLRRNPKLRRAWTPPRPEHTLNGDSKQETEASITESFEDRLDGFDEFRNLVDQNTDVQITCMTREIRDLFTVSEDHSLAHCVAEDFSMGKGIALEFKKRFGSVEVLLAQNQKTGGLAVLKQGERFIYYLVTKRTSYGKPTYETLYSSLMKMREHVESNKVRRLAMPTIGCGLDELDWKQVEVMIELIFRDLWDLKILICHWKSSRY